jgi:putative endonuclease
VLTRHERGRAAEDAVCDYLFVRGFRIVGRNRRFGPLEIDIIAEKGALAIVVEVRTRGATAYDNAFSSITHEKRRNLLRATRRLWTSELRGRREIERVRIDVAGVRLLEAHEGGVEVTYVEGAIVGGF